MLRVFRAPPPYDLPSGRSSLDLPVVAPPQSSELLVEYRVDVSRVRCLPGTVMPHDLFLPVNGLMFETGADTGEGVALPEPVYDAITVSPSQWRPGQARRHRCRGLL
jgi:hypothetical protein